MISPAPNESGTAIRAGWQRPLKRIARDAGPDSEANFKGPDIIDPNQGMTTKNKHAVALGRIGGKIGGRAKTRAKAKASRANGRLGGRPKINETRTR